MFGNKVGNPAISGEARPPDVPQTPQAAVRDTDRLEAAEDVVDLAAADSVCESLQVHRVTPALMTTMIWATTVAIGGIP